MKRSFRSRCPLLLLFLLTAVAVVGLSAPDERGERKDVVMAIEFSQVGSSNAEGDPWNDGEPSNGRILADAHLDYIYTQSHTP
ncbi:unnamed protein product [Spirodela intermedia]|uniref:Phytosulfokine n=1 Tax=Spirodela intermedia TaxID=51605 RepID=A0A7I8ISA5_SPIIN|nr:unnamed protein product [Spirodela intermedia]CAA6660734.1 unnamed protein product [Spirodela intermedia]